MAKWVRRLAAVLLSATTLVAAAAGILLVLGHGPVSETRTLLDGATWRDGQAAAAVVPLVSLLAWACIAWLALSVLTTVAATAPGRLGDAMDAVSVRIAPAAVRQVVRVALGVTLAAGTLAGSALPAGATGPAAPAGQSTSASASTTSTWTNLDWQAGAGGVEVAPTVPDLDMPASPRAPTQQAPSQQAPTQQAPGAPITSPSPLPTAAAMDSPATRPASGPAADLAALGQRVAGPSGPSEVVVHRGDTLWSIAARDLGPGASDHDVAAHWHRWYEANRAVVGNDPDVIHPGTVLQAPDAPR